MSKFEDTIEFWQNFYKISNEISAIRIYDKETKEFIAGFGHLEEVLYFFKIYKPAQNKIHQLIERDLLG